VERTIESNKSDLIRESEGMDAIEDASTTTTTTTMTMTTMTTKPPKPPTTTTRRERSRSSSFESASFERALLSREGGSSEGTSSGGGGGVSKPGHARSRSGGSTSSVGRPPLGVRHARSRSHVESLTLLRAVPETELLVRDDAAATEEEKKERRAQANRVSAAKSRLKKMQKVTELEKLCEERSARVMELRGRVEELRMKYAELATRNAELKASSGDGGGNDDVIDGDGSNAAEPFAAQGELLAVVSPDLFTSSLGVVDEFTGMTIDSPKFSDSLLEPPDPSGLGNGNNFDSDSFFAQTPPRR